ncbi:UNVERIFIED_CONTAM: hypothetical protein GTU68_057903 [Idotea baltica]|nr:hypothetical protein [Idotea baltica]
MGVRVDGSIVLHQGATDIGQGSNTVMSQIAADALGAAVDMINLVGPDTDTTPDAGKTSASRQTYVTGNATFQAAQSLRQALLTAAGVAPSGADEVEIRQGPDGLVVVSNGEHRTVPLHGQVDADGYVLVAEESYDPPTVPLDEDGQGVPYAVFGFGTQLVEVDVDIVTGRTVVINVVAAYDVGRAVNPTMVEGQIEGGVAQGRGCLGGGHPVGLVTTAGVGSQMLSFGRGEPAPGGTRHERPATMRPLVAAC